MLVHATLKLGRSLGCSASHPTPYDEVYYVLRGHGLMEFEDGEEAYEI